MDLSKRRVTVFEVTRGHKILLLAVLIGTVATFALFVLALFQIKANTANLNQERIDRNNDVDRAICSILALVPPGQNDRIDHLRNDVFHCARYGSEPGSLNVGPTATRTVPGPTPKPSRVTVTAHPSPTPGPTQTVTVHAGQGPQPVRTVTRTRTVTERPAPRIRTRTVTVAPPPGKFRCPAGYICVPPLF